MKTKKKCLALFHEKSLKELSAKETTETYGGMTKTEASWTIGYTLFTLCVGAGVMYTSFKESLFKASAARQYINKTNMIEMKVLNQKSHNDSGANLSPSINHAVAPKLPEGFYSWEDFNTYQKAPYPKRYDKYLNEDGSIKKMSTLEEIGYATADHPVATGIVMLIYGAIGSVGGYAMGGAAQERKDNARDNMRLPDSAINNKRLNVST